MSRRPSSYFDGQYHDHDIDAVEDISPAWSHLRMTPRTPFQVKWCTFKNKAVLAGQSFLKKQRAVQRLRGALRCCAAVCVSGCRDPLVHSGWASLRINSCDAKALVKYAPCRAGLCCKGFACSERSLWKALPAEYTCSLGSCPVFWRSRAQHQETHMQLKTSGGWGVPVKVVLSSCRRTNSAGIVQEQP